MQQEYAAPIDTPMDESVDDFDPFYNENGNYEPHISSTSNQSRSRDVVVDNPLYIAHPSSFPDSPLFGGLLDDDAHESHSQDPMLTYHHDDQRKPNVSINHVDTMNLQKTEGATRSLPPFDSLRNDYIAFQRGQAIRDLQQAQQRAEAYAPQSIEQVNTQGDRHDTQESYGYKNGTHTGVPQFMLPSLSDQYEAILHPPSNSSLDPGYGFPKASQGPSYQTHPYTPGTGYITTSGEYYLPQGPPEPEFDSLFPQASARVEPEVQHAQYTNDRHNLDGPMPQTTTPIDLTDNPPTPCQLQQENCGYGNSLNKQQPSCGTFSPPQGSYGVSAFSAHLNNAFTGEDYSHQSPKQEHQVTGPPCPQLEAFPYQFNNHIQQSGQIQDTAPGLGTWNGRHFRPVQHTLDTQSAIKPRPWPSGQYHSDRIQHANVMHGPVFSTYAQAHWNINCHQDAPVSSATRRRLRFANLAQAEAAMADRKVEHNWTPPVDDATLPETDSDRIEWVVELLNAMEDISVCNDKKDSDTFKNRWANPHTQFHNPQAMEKVCWKLLNIAERLHHAGPAVLEVYDSTAMKDVKKSRDLKFGNRMEAICQLLRHSKARCDKLMKGEGLDLAVGCPLQKLSLSIMNHGQNNKRQQYIEEGRVKIKGKDNVGKMKGKKKANNADETSEGSPEGEEDANTAPATNHNDNHKEPDYRGPQQSAGLQTEHHAKKYDNDSQVYHLPQGASSSHRTAVSQHDPSRSSLLTPYSPSNPRPYASSGMYGSPSGPTRPSHGSRFLKRILDEVGAPDSPGVRSKRPRGAAYP